MSEWSDDAIIKFMEDLEKSDAWTVVRDKLESKRQFLEIDLRKLEQVNLYRAQGAAELLDEMLELPKHIKAAAEKRIMEQQKKEEKSNDLVNATE